MQKSLSLTNKVLNDGSQWLINRNSKALEACIQPKGITQIHLCHYQNYKSDYPVQPNKNNFN